MPAPKIGPGGRSASLLLVFLTAYDHQPNPLVPFISLFPPAYTTVLLIPFRTPCIFIVVRCSFLLLSAMHLLITREPASIRPNVPKILGPLTQAG